MLKTVGFPSTRTGDQTIINGNEVIATVGKGINFTANTPAAGMTSQLLNWYEEGTWTPVVTPDTGSFTTVTVGTCLYTRVGRLVTISGRFTLTNSGTGAGGMNITGLPFNINTNYDGQAFTGRVLSSGVTIFGQMAPFTSLVSFQKIDGTTAIANGYVYSFNATYMVP